MKEYKKYIILGLLCISCIGLLQVFFYGFQNIETKLINIEYFQPDINETVRYNRTIEIFKPYHSNLEKLPAVILLHGELVDSYAMNNLKIEFLQNNYAVILLNLKFSYELYFELNATLNYLLTRDDLNISQIGIIGHSHGASYAFHFAWMRNESIHAIICTNFGPFGQFYLDYFDYFNRFVDFNKTWNFDTFLKNFRFQITENTPKNLLLLSNDYNPQQKTKKYYFKEDLTLWEIEEKNKFYGNFQNGTARELSINPSIFMHISGLIEPDTLYKQVDWMNQALGHENTSYTYNIVFLRVLLCILLFILIFLSGITFISKIFSYLPNIVLGLSLIGFMISLLLSLLLNMQLWVTLIFIGITGAFVMTITRKDKFWTAKKIYSVCNYTVKNKFMTRKEEITMKSIFFVLIIVEFSFFAYLLNTPEAVYFWILFYVYLMFILPYQYDIYYRRLESSSREKRDYHEIHQESSD